MAWFLVETRYVPEKFGEVRPRHREFLRKLSDEGVCTVAGPFGDGSGGVMIFQAEDEAALVKILDTDPYHLEGALAERTFREFSPVLGSWVP
ncbi:YciI family protein [Amycolatopsis sp.]|uniref:YciI family protein n=1 Tax=Amycolatopsis sp. TaxID=37632 RepID=UPI002D148CE7|nr:YciI family protein [Amycolatopsis sp.]HVV09668.1 YciI family protein [Amycolatopsis sp.]